MGDDFEFDDIREMRQLTMSESRKPMTEAQRRRRKEKKLKAKAKKKAAKEKHRRDLGTANRIIS